MINFNPSKQEKETLTAAFREEKHLGFSWDVVNNGMNSADLVNFAKAISLATEDTKPWIVFELEDEGFDRWVLLEPVGHSGEAVPNE